MTTAPYPAKGTVTRALRRDVGIIAADVTRRGYHIRGGTTYPVSVSPDLHDTINTARDSRDAANLYDSLVAAGWTVELDGNRVLVQAVPTAADQRRRVAAGGAR